MAIPSMESFFEKHTPGAHQYYEQKIRPKSDTLFLILFYAFTSLAGLVAFLQLPVLLIETMGVARVTIFGMFGLVGSLLCIVGLIFDLHWVERVGGLLLLTSVVIYGVMLINSNNGVPVALFFVCALGIMLIQRLIRIRH